MSEQPTSEADGPAYASREGLSERFPTGAEVLPAWHPIEGWEGRVRRVEGVARLAPVGEWVVVISPGLPRRSGRVADASVVSPGVLVHVGRA